MKKYGDFSIRKKLFVVYAVACLLPILLTTFYLTEELVRFTRNDTERLSYSGFEQVKVNIISKFSEISSDIGKLADNGQLINYVNITYDTDYDALISYKDKIEQIVGVRFDRDLSLFIYSDNPSLKISPITDNTISDFQTKYGIKDFQYSRIGWAASAVSSAGPKTFCGYKMLQVPNSKNSIRMIFSVEIKEDDVYPLLSADTLYPKKVYLFDDSGSILSSTERTMVFKNINELKFDSNKNLRNLKSGDIVKLAGIRYYVYYESLQNKSSVVDSSIPDWKLLYLIPFDNIQNMINQIWINCVLIIFACILISFFAALFLSKNITDRLYAIRQKTRKVLNGNFNISSPIKNRDEIGDMESSIYEMVAYIDNMVTNIYEANLKILEQKVLTQNLEKEKTAAELIALRSQINPHYLFNTLESIRMNLVLKGDRETAVIIRMFAESFRMLIENNCDIYTIKDEIGFINNYLEIQQYRFKGKFTFKIIVAEGLEALYIPKLIIEPLVENALFHGVEKKLNKCRIVIQPEKLQNDIYIKVTDDGPGMDDEVLGNLTAALSNSKNVGNEYLALRNIASRLHLLYGQNARLTISSEKGVGTIVELRIPADIRKPDSGNQPDTSLEY